MPQELTKHYPDPEPPLSDQDVSRLPVLFWSVLAITTLIHLVYALKLPLTGDEAYFWEWGRHPALGYYDHPPVTGWILWLTRQILGDTIAAVRLPAVFTGTLVIAVVYRLALDITGSVRTAAMTGLLAMGIPILSVSGVLFTTDTPVLAAGTLGGYFFHRAVNRGEKKAWIWTGTCFAVVLGSKFLGLPLLGAAALYLVLNPFSRKHLTTRGPYVAAGISLLGIVPVVIWNASNGWATFTFNFASRHSESSFNLKGIPDYLAGQTIALSPLVFLLALPILAGAVTAWKDDGDRGKRLSGFLALVPFGGFLLLSPVTKVGMHWPGVAVPFLIVALGVTRFRQRPFTRTSVAAAATAWSLTIMIFLIPLVPYLLPADWAWPLRPDKINTQQLRKVMGSPAESGEMTGTVLEEMEKEGKAFVFTKSYALSSLVAFYTPGHPEVTVLGRGSVHGRNHLLWFKPEAHKGENAVFVSYKPFERERNFLKERFTSLTPVIDSGGPEESMISVIKCYGYKGIQ